MSSFKDQLADWNKDHDDLKGAEAKAPAPVQTNKACRVISRPMRRAKTSLATRESCDPPVGNQEPTRKQEQEDTLDDADLFSAAVEGIHSQSAAILAKYDATIEAGATRVSTSQEGAVVAEQTPPRERVDPDAMAFLDAMGGLGEEKNGKTKARQLQKK